MTYTAVKYSTREEAVAAFRRMVQRKKEWMENTEKEFELYRHHCSEIQSKPASHP